MAATKNDFKRETPAAAKQAKPATVADAYVDGEESFPKRINLRVTTEQRKDLKRICFDAEVHMNSVIRQLIDDFLADPKHIETVITKVQAQ